jgi:hypothetical protein
MDRYIVNITEEQYQKSISKFSQEEQKLIKEMSKEFSKLLKEIEEDEEHKIEKFFNGNS